MENKDETPTPKKRKIEKIKKTPIKDDYASDQIKRLLKEALIDNIAENRKQSNLEIFKM